MSFDALSLDQIAAFVLVTEEGSFSAAAKRLGRAPSAVTYAIQRMESELQVLLFDRTDYRPTLTAAGRALFPRIRRVWHDVRDLRLAAGSISAGVESELTLVVDAAFDLDLVIGSLKAFTAHFPSVELRFYTESLGGAASLVRDGVASLGIVANFVIEDLALRKFDVGAIGLTYVVSPEHPLAQQSTSVSIDHLRQYVQIVLTDRSGLTGQRDHGVFTSQAWRVDDLHSKSKLLLAGIGFGGMPTHMVTADIAAGRLVTLFIEGWEKLGDTRPLSFSLAWDGDRAIGPAMQWMIDRLATDLDRGSPISS